MTYDELNRERLIRELEKIQIYLSRLADGSEDASTLQNELAIICLRMNQLTLELKSHEASRKAAPPAKVILVVDDNDEFRTLIRQVLELSDYRVLEASDGNEALAILHETAAVDLILCDIILPEMKGPDLVKMIRRILPDVKVIFMSGYITVGVVNQDVEQVVASGSHFISKPFPTRKILEAIHDELEN